MATVKGQNLRLFIGGIVVAASKQCDLNVRLDVQESSTKDDTGDWASQMVVRLGWELRANGVVTVDPDRNDPASLLNRIGDTVQVELALASGEQNSVKGDIMLAGQAIISDVSITATNREESVYQVTLTGQSNMLFPLSVLCSGDPYRIITADEKRIIVDPD